MRDPSLTRISEIDTELASISRQLLELTSSRAEHADRHRTLVEKLNSKLNEANDEKQRQTGLRSKILVPQV